MDILIPKLQQLNPPNHHSTTDWDKYLNFASWSLNTAKYISPPSSLSLYCQRIPTMTGYATFISKVAKAQNLKEGRIITYHNQQAPPPWALPRIIYGCNQDHTIKRGVNIRGDNAWLKARFTWWNSFDLQNQPKLAIRLDTWNGTQWIPGATSYQDRLTGIVNRCGIGTLNIVDSTTNPLFDDTEIWAPQP